NRFHLVIADLAPSLAFPLGNPLGDTAIFIGAHSLATPARLTAAYPTVWVFNRLTNTYDGYITIYNLGPAPLTGTLNVTLSLLPKGVSVSALAPGWVGNTYTNTISFGAGKSIRIAVKLNNPAHSALPT